MLRRLPPHLAVAVLIGASLPAAASDPPKKGAPPDKNSWISPALIKTGLGYLKDKSLAISPTIDFRPSFQFYFAPKAGLINIDNVNLNFGALTKEQQEVTERLAREANDIQKAQLVIQKQQLDVQIEQAKIQLAQKQLGDAAFAYMKDKDNALLRRPDYTLPANKLVVVVADFSCGGSSEGVEVADEIASALHELRNEFGIDIEILAGEIKPGVVIRSERMAQDVGRHFPKGTCYAVVWGTLSPRTVGKFRPYVTCAVKVDDDLGVSRSYTIDPGSQPLPLGDTPEEQRRDRHRQLVGFTCAVVPGCYISHALMKDERPNLDKFFARMKPEVPDLVAQYEAQMAPLAKWVETQKRYTQLRRLTVLEKGMDFPRLVVNARDNGVMTLITDPKTNQPKVYDHPDGGRCVVYIDVLETTNRQALKFLTEKGNKPPDVGRPWFKIEADVGLLRPEGDGFVVFNAADNADTPVFNVSHTGATAYCRWAWKELPRVAEWRDAAAPERGAKFPWGDDPAAWKTHCANGENSGGEFRIHRCGSFAASDRSRIGCFDMAGNVSEWCEDVDEKDRGKHRYCGGNHGDKSPESFAIDRHDSRLPETRDSWLGFRGVVRVKLP